MSIEIVEIFPPIGVAHVGDADSAEYFFVPEVPGQTTYPIGSDGKPITAFRLANGQIKQQAVKFRVYGFDQNGKCIKELTKEDGYKLTWTVNVANTKAAALHFRGRYRPETTVYRNPDVEASDRSTLKITPPQTEINSDNTAVIRLEGKFLTKPVLLGSIAIEAQSGRLIFRGGNGCSEYVGKDGHVPIPQPDIVSEFDSVSWHDDVCDGWVDVKVERGNWSMSAAHKATVITSSPKFAWGIRDTTNLYDVIEDIYKTAKHSGIPADTRFYRDIWPVLQNACAIAWTNIKASQGHGSDGRGYFIAKEIELSTPPTGTSDPYHGLRQSIFDKLRQPGNPDHANLKYMPRLSGDDGDAVEAGDINPAADAFPIGRFGSLTELQYSRFKNWADGNFVKDSKGASSLPPDVETHPDLLTRAALEQTIGTELYPGLEIYWIAKEAHMYDIRVNAVNPPFRFNYAGGVQPGDLTARLSLPWQSDYALCNLHWWPSARPDDVVTATTSGEVRKRWARGLRITPDDLSSFPENTDMVKYWSRLGFVVKDAHDFKWTETERLTIPPPS